eukprot:1155616-Pelagomonas_calceolata.AAC.6
MHLQLCSLAGHCRSEVGGGVHRPRKKKRWRAGAGVGARGLLRWGRGRPFQMWRWGLLLRLMCLCLEGVWLGMGAQLVHSDTELGAGEPPVCKNQRRRLGISVSECGPLEAGCPSSSIFSQHKGGEAGMPKRASKESKVIAAPGLNSFGALQLYSSRMGQLHQGSADL